MFRIARSYATVACGSPLRCASWLHHIPLQRAIILGGGRRSRSLRLRLAALPVGATPGLVACDCRRNYSGL